MKLNDDEKSIYLANLVAVSRADGSISPNEIQAIEASQKAIGARKTALKKAEKLAESEGFIPTAVGPFSARIANLEDMMLVSLIDGALDQAEKSAVLVFAKKIGITNDQLQQVLSEVKAFLASSSATRACPKCSAKVQRDAKFCPECGHKLEMPEAA